MRRPSLRHGFPAGPVPLPLLVGSFCLLWSAAFSVGKLGLADCPPFLLLTMRFLIAGLVMLGAAALRGSAWRSLTRRDVAIFAVLGVFNNALYLGLNYTGIVSISSGLSVLIISMSPVLTAVLAATFLDEPMTWRKAAGLVLGIGGVAFIVRSRLAVGGDSLSGILFTIAALASLVCGTILFKRLAPGGDRWIGNGVQNLAGAAAIMPFAFSLERVGDIVPSWRLVLALAYLALLGSIVAYVLWFHLLDTAGATAASAYYFLMPPLGMLFGLLLLGEHVAASDLIGVVPVALGIWLATRPVRRPTTTVTADGPAKAGCQAPAAPP
jgi:drug/metabolite transporter (DMT)-like permease